MTFNWKWIGVFFILLCGTIRLQAQAALIVLVFGDKVASENFFFSMKGGLNLSNCPGLPSSEMRAGATFGLVANVRITDRLSFTPEFLPLSVKGSNGLEIPDSDNPILDPDLLESASRERNLRYIDLPLLFRFNAGKRFSLSVGPQISFLTGGTDIYDFEGNEGGRICLENDLKDSFNTLDVGIALDLGYTISGEKNGKAMELHARYTEGFIDVPKSTEESFLNRIFQVALVFPFQLDETNEP